MRSLIWASFLSFSVNAFAIPLIDCNGTLLNGDSGEIWRTKLKVSSEDPNFFQGFIGNYSFGADDSYLGEEGVGLIVMNNTTEVFASSLMGFRRIGKTKIREARLQLYDKTKSGELMIGTVRCGYTEP